MASDKMLGSFDQKSAPEDNDLLVEYDAAASKVKNVKFGGVWNWIVKKLTSAVINELQTSSKNVVGAINELNSKTIYVNNVTDLNNPPNYAILNTKVNPIGLPSGLKSNGCLVIQQNLGKGNYSAQLAFSFGSDKIAIRRKYNTNNWTEWKYFTAQ